MYRFALYYPGLVSHLFSICTPYTPPSSQYVALQDIVQRLPQFGYQVHLASGEVENVIQSPEQIRQFLNGVYGGRHPEKKRCFDPQKGIVFEALPRVDKSPLLSDAVRDQGYIRQYSCSYSAGNGLLRARI